MRTLVRRIIDIQHTMPGLDTDGIRATITFANDSGSDETNDNMQILKRKVEV